MATLLGIVLVILMCLSVESAQSSATTRPSEGNHQNSDQVSYGQSSSPSFCLHFSLIPLPTRMAPPQLGVKVILFGR
jgi:hypothetical protein